VGIAALSLRRGGEPRKAVIRRQRYEMSQQRDPGLRQMSTTRSLDV
jgi:hypothetical protein